MGRRQQLPQMLAASGPLKQQCVLRQLLSCMHGAPFPRSGVHWVPLQNVPMQQLALVLHGPVLVQLAAQRLALVHTLGEQQSAFVPQKPAPGAAQHWLP